MSLRPPIVLVLCMQVIRRGPRTSTGSCTRNNRKSSWRKSFFSTSTSRSSARPNSPDQSDWPTDRWRSGFRIGERKSASAGVNTTVWRNYPIQVWAWPRSHLLLWAGPKLSGTIRCGYAISFSHSNSNICSRVITGIVTSLRWSSKVVVMTTWRHRRRSQPKA